ncbi:MAG: hypothetical protein ACFFDI_26440 [Promethearchaeota archaeon]
MNYKSINTRQKTEPVVHKCRIKEYNRVPVGTSVQGYSMLCKSYFTICGHRVQGNSYRKWEQTEEPVTCKQCLRILNQESVVKCVEER